MGRISDKLSGMLSFKSKLVLAGVMIKFGAKRSVHYTGHLIKRKSRGFKKKTGRFIKRVAKCGGK